MTGAAGAEDAPAKAWGRLPLLPRLIASLLAVAAIPLAISYYQIRVNRDAVIGQAQRTHLVAADSTASRIDAWIGALQATMKALADHPQLVADPKGSAGQELLRAMLQTRPDILALGLFDASGETLVLAQRRDHRATVGDLLDRRAAEAVRFASIDGDHFLRLATLGPAGIRVVLVADAGEMENALRVDALGRDVAIALTDLEGQRLVGDHQAIEDLPHLTRRAMDSGKLGALSGRYDLPDGRAVVVAAQQLRTAPFVVVSAQPASSTLVALHRIRRGAWIATVGALLLAGVLSYSGWVGFIRPLRRVVEAQRALLGDDARSKGDEVAQLEASFRTLEARMQDRDDLRQVFLDRYQVLEQVGRGSMGSVFKSWDPTLKRPVALKTIRFDRAGEDRDRLTDKLLDEAAIHARFVHPNIVTVYDVAREGAAAFIAMEYVDGTTLHQLLRWNGKLPIGESVALGLAVARALANAHGHDLVHHDVKPGNILLGRDRSIKVTDFGVSQVTTLPQESRKSVVGTAGYLAPECIAGEGYTTRSDLFALGVVIYEALAGFNPLLGRNLRETIAATLDLELTPIQELRPETPLALVDLVTRLLAPEPSERPASADAVVEVLERLARTGGYTWDLDPVATVGEHDGKPSSTSPTEPIKRAPST